MQIFDVRRYASGKVIVGGFFFSVWLFVFIGLNELQFVLCVPCQNTYRMQFCSIRRS